MILVLLTRFCDSEESIAGYKLCQVLVKQGHELYVTTISTGEAIEAEIRNAEEISMKGKGNVTLLHPNYAKHELPNPEWIVMHYQKYFSYLSKMNDVEVIIGLLPGTEETATELKALLECRLILLSCTKMEISVDDLNATHKLTEFVDEIWSIGSDIQSHNETIFQNVKHKEIMLQPTTSSLNDSVETNDLNFVSVWKSSLPMFKFRRKINSTGSKISDFGSLNSVFNGLNGEFRAESGINWTIHCSPQPDVIETLGKLRNINISMNTSLGIQKRLSDRNYVVKITPMNTAMSIDNLPMKQCRAFIVPDYVEESFNFLALNAIWLGVPTLVSSQSSIGKFLLNLEYPEKYRAVVNLTGDPDHDKQAWVQKINTEILSHEAHSIQWAKALAEHLHTNNKLWNLDLFQRDSHITSRRLSDSSVQSLATSQEDPLSRVPQWQRDHFYSEPIRTRRIGVYKYPSTSQTSIGTIATPSSSLSNLSTNQSTADLAQCTEHGKGSLEFFCQDCKVFICHTCRPLHTGHDILGLQEQRDKLTSLLHDWKTQAEKADRRRAEVLECIAFIKSSSAESQEKMENRLDFVKGELAMVFHSEIKKLKGSKRDQVKKLEKEASDLEQFSINRKIAQKRGRRILKQEVPSTFIRKSSTFMLEAEAAKLPEKTISRQLQYRPPSSAPEDLRNLLGLFIDPVSDQQGPRLLYDRFRGQSNPDLAFEERILIDFHGVMDVKRIKGSPVSSVSNCIFKGDSIWASSWQEDILGKFNTVFLNIKCPKYKLLSKKKKKLLLPCCPNFVFLSGDFIFFGEKGGNEIYQFNTVSHEFKLVAVFPILNLVALCGNEANIYILNKNHCNHIRIYDLDFETDCKIVTGLDQIQDGDIDMCLTSWDAIMRHTVAICTADPASVRVVNKGGIIWTLHYYQCPEHFSPCSITSADGQIYTADRGTDKVSTIR